MKIVKNDKDETYETAIDARKDFLSHSQRVISLLGKELNNAEFEMSISQRKAVNLMFPIIGTMINGVNDRQQIEAENTKDIIKMLKDGALSIAEAKDLMQMLSVQSDIEDIKQLLEKVNQLTDGAGNTYNG